MLSVYPKNVLFGTDIPPVLSPFTCKFHEEWGYCAPFMSLTVRANASCLLASKQRPGQPGVREAIWLEWEEGRLWKSKLCRSMMSTLELLPRESGVEDPRALFNLLGPWHVRALMWEAWRRFARTKKLPWEMNFRMRRSKNPNWNNV